MAVDLNTIFTPMLALVIIIVGLGLGADSKIEDFKHALKNPRAIVVGLLSQYGFMPLLAYIFVRSSPVSEYQKIGIILTGASPGGTTSNLFTLWAHGNVPLSITMSFFSTLAAFFMLPLMIIMYIETLSSATVDIPWSQIFASLILIALPTTIGLYIRKKNTTWKLRGRFAWEWLKIATSVFGVIFVFGALAVAIIVHYEKLRDAEPIFWILAFSMEVSRIKLN
jgi:BASS family bile acid:Na+ symporter